MKKILVLGLVSIFVSGCGWMDSSDGGLTDETSQFVDNGEVAVWYEDVDRSISLRMPDSMEGYESSITEVSEENIYGTVERVEFLVNGGPVAVLNVHARDMVQANLMSFEFAAEDDESEYLYTFATTLSGESELQTKLMDMSFNLENYLTFE